MPFHIPGSPGTFYRPGERKNNRAIAWRGRNAAGKWIEIVTDALAESAAARHVRNFLEADARSRPPEPGATVDLATAARHYAGTVNPSRADEARIAFLTALHGHLPVRGLGQAHVNEACQAYREARAEAIRQAAEDLKAWQALERKPVRKDGHRYKPPRVPQPPSTDTVNREIVTPYRAILHFAAGQQWCNDIRIAGQKPPAGEKPRQPVRVARDEDVETLLATPAIADFPDRRAFVLLVHERGARISDLLRLRREWLDLSRARARVLITKPTRRWFEFDLSPATVAALANLNLAGEGRVFGWGARSNVYRWLRTAEKQCGVKWRPHESRRAVVSAVMRNTGDPVIARDYVGHGSVKTTLRYRHAEPGELTPETRQRKA